MNTEYQIIAALALDFILGDPRGIPHPVKIIGRFAASLEGPLRAVMSPRRAGTAAAVLVIAATAVVTGGMIYLAYSVHSWAGDAFSVGLLYMTFAARDLAGHSGSVLQTLDAENMPEARRRVSRMVGRDTETLDEEGIVRAAVESVAENSVDGIVSPLFYAAVAGPVGAMVYKAVNTLDSTFGYRNERYIEFGRASAKIDDAANYIPARLSVLLIALAALLTGMKARDAFCIGRRDGRNHPSPNSGWSEAAFAGALGIRLGGPVMRKGVPEMMPYLGDAGEALRRRHIRKANTLMLATAVLAAFLFAGARSIIERMIA